MAVRNLKASLKRSARRGRRRVSAASARRFIASAKLPPIRLRAAPPGEVVETALDAAKNQAAVAGAEIVSFVSGVTAERREAILHSSLLAQLLAKQAVPNAGQVEARFAAYLDVLQNIGWVVQETDFAEYRKASQNLDAHEEIIAVATLLLGTAAPTALALVKTTLEALKSMDPDSPWLTIFSRESQSGRTAHFQLSLAEQDPNGQFLVNLMAFSVEAKSTITQVLFFKTRSSEATLQSRSGRVTIDTVVLEGVLGDIKAKLAEHAKNYIKTLPDLE